ncbi:type III-B CRISPR module RAMP protein Cmr4 [Candidatus Halobeggiatoa sp. HSG11]|nr:type III-B CRISPR module RAMP protein Cmr4 [Candidatus Halobeggiatoa sp. HSG11]
MKQAILSLLTETSLHAGTGQMTGVIDLPIQRESHTDWPCVYGSAVKGAMRMLATEYAKKDKNCEVDENNNLKKDCWVNEVFGPEEGNEHAGSVAISDAKLLLLPVRSLTGYFKLVTCPALLERLQRDCKRLGFKEVFSTEIPDDNQAFISDESTDNLFLEEFRFETKKKDLEKVINVISILADINKLEEQLVIVNNDIFSHLARYATPVNAHIKIDNDTKIVKKGQLWYEETLPSDTLLYTTVAAFKSRKDKSEKTNSSILKHIMDLFSERPYLQIGGNETVGMGWCKIKTWKGD